MSAPTHGRRVDTLQQRNDDYRHDREDAATAHLAAPLLRRLLTALHAFTEAHKLDSPALVNEIRQSTAYTEAQDFMKGRA